MEAPDLPFMVQSFDAEDEHGRRNRGSKVVQVQAGNEPPEWRLRDFGFAAYSRADAAPGLRPVHFGRRAAFVFATPREHCEEIAVFRRGCDVRRKWEGDALHEPKVGLDAFSVVRVRQITEETPLSKHFNGEWGFWESFFAPILDDAEQSIESLQSLSASDLEGHFQSLRLPVTTHAPPAGGDVLSVPDSLIVRCRAVASCADVEVWGDFCGKLGEDMVLQAACIFGEVPVKLGSECVQAASEMDGVLAGSKLKKRDLERLRLPVELTFESDMHVAAEWRPDTRYLQRKFDALGEFYESNLMNNYSALGRQRPDPWHPMNRLAVNALSQVLARYPEIRTVLDVGCGDMAWMAYVLQEHPELTYVGADILPYCLAVNFRRFPKGQFIQTDLSNLSGIEVLPRGCDLVIAKEVFNQMVLPDAVDALRRVVSTRPRFLLTHIHVAADNSGWETRIDKHLEYTAYNYNKPPFSLPYPVMDVQKITEDSAFVLYQIMPDKVPDLHAIQPPPPFVENLGLPDLADDLDVFVTIADGELVEAQMPRSRAPSDDAKDEKTAAKADELGPKPPQASEKREEAPAPADKKPIKGVPAVEFRARCDLIFEKFDRDKDGALLFEELVALMDAGGRRIEEYDAYASLCGRLGCDPRMGLGRRDVYKLFEKAPQTVWEEIYRSINPLAQMVKKGAEKLPMTFLERPLPNFLFDDGESVAKVVVDINDHMYFGAADVVTSRDVQAFFGKQRLEVHAVAPGSYGGQDLYLWKLVVTPLAGEIVPEDCTIEFRETTEKAGMKGARIVVKVVKSRPKRWAKLGQAATGQRV